MSGLVFTVVVLMVVVLILGSDTVAHYCRLRFLGECEHRIPEDMPCRSCEADGRYRTWQR